MAGAPADEITNIYLRFHDNHGTNIKLGPQKILARRRAEQEYDGIVMSDQPMETGFLYQVLMTEVQLYYSSSSLGVVSRPPETFYPLPQSFGHLDHHVLCVEPYITWEFYRAIPKPNPILSKLPVGSKLGLAIDFFRNLHLFFNEADTGIVGSNVPSPCWFMLDMSGYMKAVTCLPVQCLLCRNFDLTPYPSHYYPNYVYDQYYPAYVYR